MKLLHLFLFALVVAVLPACEALSGVAPEDTPRVEVELMVDLGTGFTDPLVDADADLDQAVREVVRSQADLGLRFYATPSEKYGANDRRPPYVMAVEVDALYLRFKRTTVEEEGQAPWVSVSVDKIACEVRASVQRRRDNGPPLEVSTAESKVEMAANGDPDALNPAREYAVDFEGQRVMVRESDLLEVVERATDKALKSMRTPIDREFAHLRTTDTGS